MKRMKRIGLWVLVLMVLFTGCGKPSSTLELPGGGYTALAEVDGTCYLVENSGIIYTLDWDTGERSVYYKAPVDVAWVADSDMAQIYYMEGDTLHCIDVAADEDTSICVLQGLPQYQPFLGVTDHFLIYKQANDSLAKINIWCMDLETQATRLLLSWEQGTFGVLLATRQDTTYLNFYRTGPTEEDRYSRIVAMDLATGEDTLIGRVEMKAYTPQPYNPLHNTFCNVMTDNLLFFENGRYYINDDPRDYTSETAVCALPLDGNAEAQALALTGAVQSGRMYLSTDARLLVNCDTEDPVLTLYRYDAEIDTATELTQINSLRRVFGAVTNGQRYAMLAGDNWEVTALILGDLK